MGQKSWKTAKISDKIMVTFSANLHQNIPLRVEDITVNTLHVSRLEHTSGTPEGLYFIVIMISLQYHTLNNVATDQQNGHTKKCGVFFFSIRIYLVLPNERMKSFHHFFFLFSFSC